jgi:8-oxo-dGTP pyrophosphatase MutT (NUDIX family)/GNAT superfamily N-acetyltransferase
MRAHEFTDQGAAGIVLYAEDTGRYGLQQRSETVGDPGLWAAWGGGREPGETLEQCARRELAEEGGYTGPIQLQRLGENLRYVTFLGRVPHEFAPRADSEWQDYCWVEAGDWPAPMHPGTAAALQNISVNESVPQPGASSGAPTQFAPGTQIQNQQMTAKQIISSIPGVPYYNNVVDDWDAKDFSWGVTKKVIEYAEYLKQHPESLAKLPPIQVVNGQFKDGAHRVSAVWLLQQRMDPQNPLWKNAKLNVQFAQQNVAEGLENNRISFQVQKAKNKFATTLSIGNNPVGVYQYDADTGRSIAEVYPEFKGKGLGKLLVLHAIYTAAQLGLNFQEDESRTAEYDNVLDSLSSNGYIVDDDGYWYVTGEGEQYLQQSMKQGVAEGKLVESAVFLNPTTVVVGQAHGQPLELSPNTLKQIQAIAAKHGAWYEGNGTDRGYTKGQIDRYVGSWDDEVAKTANSNDPKWIYVLFANVDENNRVQRVGIDPNDTIFNRLLDTAKDNSFQGIGYTSQALQKFLQMASEGKYDFVKMSQQPATQENLTRFLKAGESLMWPSNWEQYPNKAGKIAKAATVDVRDQYLATRKAGVYVTGSGHLKAVQNITGKQGVAENFADGKNPGRKGLAKRSGVNTKASVSSLRKTAKNSSGEKQRMSHWLANMKAGRAKAKRK